MAIRPEFVRIAMGDPAMVVADHCRVTTPCARPAPYVRPGRRRPGKKKPQANRLARGMTRCRVRASEAIYDSYRHPLTLASLVLNDSRIEALKFGQVAAPAAVNRVTVTEDT